MFDFNLARDPLEVFFMRKDYTIAVVAIIAYLVFVVLASEAAQKQKNTVIILFSLSFFLLLITCSGF